MGTEEDSCRQLPGGSSRAWRRRVRGLPREQGWAGGSPGRDPAPPAGQPPARHPERSTERDRNHEKRVCRRFQVLLSEPSPGRAGTQVSQPLPHSPICVTPNFPKKLLFFWQKHSIFGLSPEGFFFFFPSLIELICPAVFNLGK